jgi:hypothetical protein
MMLNQPYQPYVIDRFEERPDIFSPRIQLIRSSLARARAHPAVHTKAALTVAQDDNPTSNVDSMSGMAEKS